MFLVLHGGPYDEPQYCKNSLDVSSYLCSYYGLDWLRAHEKIMAQIDKLKFNETITHPDLAISVQRIAKHEYETNS